MESTAANKYQKLVRMLELLRAGENRSLSFLREIKAEVLATGLNEDDRCSGLLMALDLFGVPGQDLGLARKALAIECWSVLRLLKEHP
jgi:hypothetical protein